MAYPLRISGVLPLHAVVEHETRGGTRMSHHTFEANAHHATDATSGVVTMRVVHGRIQVVGVAGREAWSIGAGDLVVLGGSGPYDIVALEPSEMWMGVHETVPRGPRLVLA
jgi:hypothetical protein